MNATAATTRDERALFFGGEADTSLLGILTVPPTNPLGVGALVLPGGGFVGSTRRNQLGTRISRLLATYGFHAMRLDWHGVGDSSGRRGGFDLEQPAVEDLLGAVSEFRKHVGRFVIVGSCFGARTALVTAPGIEGLEAMFLAAPPIVTPRPRSAGEEMADEWTVLKAVRAAARISVIKRLLHPQRRRTVARFAKAKARSLISGSRTQGSDGEASVELQVSPNVLAGLECIASSAVSTHLLYGDRDSYYTDLEVALSGSLGEVFARGDIRVVTVAGTVHEFQRVEAQDALLEHLGVWAAGMAGRPSNQVVPIGRDA